MTAGRVMLKTLLVGLLAFSAACSRSAEPPPSYSGLIGSPAPSWEIEEWLNSAPLSLESLRGRPVLVRWWTGPSCPLCSASAPRLARLHRLYRDRGLQVVGFYHHKGPGPLDSAEVKRMAQKLGMDFPIAVDPDWINLERYWLDRVPGNRFTSVTFLIGPDGLVRYIHPGGEIDEADAAELERAIQALL